MIDFSALSLDDAVEAFYQQRGSTIVTEPYPLYARLRSEAPAYLRTGRFRPFFIITRYADVSAVLSDPRFVSDRNYGDRTNIYMRTLPEPDQTCGIELQRYLSRMVITSDPPEHSRLRGLLQPAFMPRTVELMRQRTQGMAEEALQAVLPTGRLEVMGQFARPLSTAFKQEMLDVPREDRADLQRWSRDIAVFMGGWQGIAQAHRSMSDLNEYLRGIIAQRRGCPGEDLLSVLVEAEAQGDRLREDELFANALGLIFLGTSGVANLIGNGLLALVRHSDQLALLRGQRELMESAVEEMLRYDSPDQAVLRVASETCEVAGQRIEAGQAVSLWIGSANRDPERFAEPDLFDIRRGDNRHLAFAAGPHYCLGAALARMQAHTVFTTMLRVLSDLRLDTDEVRWEGSLNLRSLKELPVSFRATAA